MWLGTRWSGIRDFKIQRGEGNEDVAYKVNLRSFSLYSDYSYPLALVKCRRTLLKLNFKGPNPSSEREIKFRRCFFTSSIKRKIRHFHVVVVQKQERNVQSEVVVLLMKLIVFVFVLFFLTFSLPSASLDLKVPNKEKQRWRGRLRKRHFKREFALLQTWSFLFHLVQFVKCWQIF